jgi:uncharacterized protein YecE (DUF72 family)
MPEIMIGCSGFSYKHWKDVFYPSGLPQKKWLAYYSRFFRTVELNVTFYHLPSHPAFHAWHQETPPGFVFAVKGSRFITHVKRLLDPGAALEKFFEGAFLFKEKLGPVLWQLPPAFKLDRERFCSFLVRLLKYPVRHAFEFRHESWLSHDIINLCRDNNIGLCMADSPPYLDDLPVTADFVYIRRHGQAAEHAGSYSKSQLTRDSNRISRFLRDGKDVYAYFNNDAHGYAIMNASELAALSGIPGNIA